MDNGGEDGIVLPDDYEACGICGFDHAYEPLESEGWHKRNAEPEMSFVLVQQAGVTLAPPVAEGWSVTVEAAVGDVTVYGLGFDPVVVPVGSRLVARAEQLTSLGSDGVVVRLRWSVVVGDLSE
jgi:hypothetical protein